MAIAEHDAKTAKSPPKDVELRTKHIEQVIQMSDIFKEYLNTFKGGDEPDRAYRDRARMDREKASDKPLEDHGLREMTRRGATQHQ